MNDLNGNVTIPKLAWDHDRWQDEAANRKSALLDLWRWANDRPRTIILKGKTIELNQGQMVRSQVSLATSWHWSREKVQSFLKTAREENLINCETYDGCFTIITVIDYGVYNPDTSLDPAAVPAAVPAAGNSVDQTGNPAQKGEVGSRKMEGGRATEGAGFVEKQGAVSGEIPSDTEVKEYASNYADLSRGIQGIPEQWWTGWLGMMVARREFPRDWRRAMALAFISDFVNGHPKARGLSGMPAGSGNVKKEARLETDQASWWEDELEFVKNTASGLHIMGKHEDGRRVDEIIRQRMGGHRG